MADRTDSPSERGELLAQLQQVLEEPLALETVDDPGTLVEALPAQNFVQLARVLREENRLDLLIKHATASQLTILLDLDAWTTEDRVDIPRARSWLVTIADAYASAHKPRGALVELMYEMDPEMWTMALLAGTQVIDLDPEDDASRQDSHGALGHLRTWDTPDGFFVVGVPDDEMGRMVLHTVNLLYADDLSEGRKLLLSIQNALGSQIEDDLSRWRSGRLADLGFVPTEEAMKLFRPLDHVAAAQAEPRDFRYLPDETETGLSMQSWTSSELLKRVMAQLPPAEHGLRAREFLLLVNEVMAGQKFPPGDEKLQARAIIQTQSTISLGLEMLMTTRPEHPDPEAFLADRIVAIGLRDVFRVGYGALARLRKAATVLHQSARISLSGPGSLLDRPFGTAITALMQWYPELPLQETSAGTRPLKTFADVSKATTLVAQAGALAQLAFASEGFAIDPAWISRVDEPDKLVIGDLIRSAIVHAHLPGSRTVMAPLTPADLHWGKENLLSGADLSSTVMRDFSARCDALGVGEHTQILADVVLTRMKMELLNLEYEDGTPDLTRVGGFLTIQSVSMWLKLRTGDEPN